MKKTSIIKKILVLISAFAIPTIASPQTCNCYNQFNSGFQPLYSMYTTCVSNYLYTPVAAWGNYATTQGSGGAISAASALYGLQNCNNTFNTELDKLGGQFDSCITNYCS